MRSVIRLLVVFLVTLMCGSAAAQTDPPGEIGALLKWLSKPEAKCSERCFTLDRLRLRGSVSGTLTFELEGTVLAEHPIAVPLFGPPDKVRVDGVTEGGKPVPVGFEGDHYYVFTGAKRFLVKGSLTLQKDLALTLTGPLNTLEADLETGRVVEGARLSGLAATTIHFDGGAAGKGAEEPTVFQLSRAIRVAREVGFEYHLTMRSGSDLGVIRLPLAYGEKVLEVSGSMGWKVEGTELVLPTAGKSAQVTVTGTLAQAGQSFSPDARSAYEWWLLESDAEHRLTAGGDAKQLDAVESPIPKTRPSSRLFLVKKAQKLELSVQTLSAVEALAAVVREQHRMIVLTQKGDLVSDDSLVYENNGVDYLAFTPSGRPIFLASDGMAEKILRKDGDPNAVMVPLRKGAHSARVQSLSQASLGLLFGRIVVPTPDHALTASRATVSIGLPENVHPIAVFGGDKPLWLLEVDGALAAMVGFVLSWLLFSTRRDRILGTLALTGLFFIAPTAFRVVIGVAVVALALRIALRRLRGKGTTTQWILGFVGVALCGAIVVGLGTRRSGEARYRLLEDGRREIADLPVGGQPSPVSGKQDESSVMKEARKSADAAPGYFGSSLEVGGAVGVLDGVAPVALPLPGYARIVTVSREIVTHERPFRPVLVYVTETTVLAGVVAWLVIVGLLGWSQRARLLALRDRARAWATTVPTPVPAAPVAQEPPAPAE
jgi:hypothetical protein